MGSEPSASPRDDKVLLLSKLEALPASVGHPFFEELGSFLGKRQDCFAPLLRELIESEKLSGNQLLAACWGLLYGARRSKNRADFRRDLEISSTSRSTSPRTHSRR